MLIPNQVYQPQLLSEKIRVNSGLIICIYCFILILCHGCTINPPPLEFAPNPTIIEKAIVFQIQQKQNNLSQQLQTKPPEISISKINVNKIEPKIKFNLPTYHLEGTYQLKLKVAHKKARQITNTFQIDLQRQKQGKTWRLIDLK
jgi:hypothetical protein